MVLLWRSAAVTVLAAVVATAAAGTAEAARPCRAAPRSKVRKVEVQAIACRVGLEIIAVHERSVERRGACRVRQGGSGFCKVQAFQCFTRVQEPDDARVLCVARGDRKVIFRFRARLTPPIEPEAPEEEGANPPAAQA